MGDVKYALAGTTKDLPEQVRQKQLTWSQHVLSWVDAKELNRRIIRYEDMLAEPIGTFTQAAEFLQLPTEFTLIEKAIRFSNFKELSRQESEKGFKERLGSKQRFFRVGHSGDWRHKLSSKQIQLILKDHGHVMQRFGYLDNLDNPI
jgi:hypothetical protein